MDEDVLFFEMGLYQAPLPVRLRYAEIHFWFQVRDGRTRCGLTSYAMRLLDDVFRLDWKLEAGQTVEDGQAIGEIESTKASSELYAPMAGKVTAINPEPVEHPGRIGVDPYAHWLLEFEGAPEFALDAVAYRAHLEATWDETQRLLKGQM
ncbi:MAG: glycine cleavage system protein H [Planctomycetota bacterium]|nr:glycine cleavage system protein H [Planctomycetota bacterium]